MFCQGFIDHSGRETRLVCFLSLFFSHVPCFLPPRPPFFFLNRATPPSCVSSYSSTPFLIRAQRLPACLSCMKLSQFGLHDVLHKSVFHMKTHDFKTCSDVFAAAVLQGTNKPLFIPFLSPTPLLGTPCFFSSVYRRISRLRSTLFFLGVHRNCQTFSSNSAWFLLLSFTVHKEVPPRLLWSPQKKCH